MNAIIECNDENFKLQETKMNNNIDKIQLFLVSQYFLKKLNKILK